VPLPPYPDLPQMPGENLDIPPLPPRVEISLPLMSEMSNRETTSRIRRRSGKYRPRVLSVEIDRNSDHINHQNDHDTEYYDVDDNAPDPLMEEVRTLLHRGCVFQVGHETFVLAEFTKDSTGFHYNVSFRDAWK
jgi:hypothetical protein